MLHGSYIENYNSDNIVSTIICHSYICAWSNCAALSYWYQASAGLLLHIGCCLGSIVWLVICLLPLSGTLWIAIPDPCLPLCFGQLGPTLFPELGVPNKQGYYIRTRWTCLYISGSDFVWSLRLLSSTAGDQLFDRGWISGSWYSLNTTLLQLVGTDQWVLSYRVSIPTINYVKFFCSQFWLP